MRPDRITGRLAAALVACCIAAPSQAEEALAYSVSWTAESWANVHGGAKRGAALLGNLDLGLGLDGGAALGWPGLRLLLRGLIPHGASPSALVGDSQTVSNIDADPGLRLFEAWAEQALGPASLRLGLYDLNSEFDAIEAAALFVHSSHGIGAELAAAGHNGPSIFPVTSLTFRLKAELGGLELLAAALDGVPGDPNAPALGGVHLSQEDGALLIAQAGWKSEHWRVAGGAWRYTAVFPDLAESLSLSGNGGLYVLGEGTLPGLGALPGRLSAFARMGLADARLNPFDAYLGAGFVWEGPLPSRPGDSLGLAVAVARHGESYRRACAAGGAPVPALETALELTYQLPVTGWLTLQPDLQYVMSPGSDAKLPDSLALALRLVLAFEGTADAGGPPSNPAWQPASARSDDPVARAPAGDEGESP